MIKFIGENIFSIITATVAIIAIWQTHRQIKISNKHQLFDRRVDRFILIKGLISLFEDSKHLMNKEDYNHFIDVTVLFHSLTNNTYLKDIGKIIDNVKQEDIRQSFLVKLEDFKKISIEVEFIFSKKNIRLIKEFVYKYQELLRTMYEEQIILDKIMERTEKIQRNLLNYRKNLARKGIEKNYIVNMIKFIYCTMKLLKRIL